MKIQLQAGDKIITRYGERCIVTEPCDDGETYYSDDDCFRLKSCIAVISRHPPVTEVKRFAHAGEYIKITYTSDELSKGCYNIGDIFKVCKTGNYRDGVVHVESETPMFEKLGCNIIDPCEYVVMENYYEKT